MILSRDVPRTDYSKQGPKGDTGSRGLVGTTGPQGTPGTSGTGISSGANGAVQFSDGAGGFLGDTHFIYDGSSIALTIGAGSTDTFIFDPSGHKVQMGTNAPVNQYDLDIDFTANTFQLLGEPDLTNTLSQIASGYKLFSQVTSNQTKGDLTLWPGLAVFLQTYHYSGHDYDRYSSLNPYEDSILHTKGSNIGQPLQTMDLGMSSRIPIANRGGSVLGYGYNAGTPTGQWPIGDDNDFRPDPHAVVSFPNWNTQVQFKTSVPGIYVQERRWDWVIARQNHTTSLQLRSSDRPSFDPLGGPIEGIDFYDLKIGSFEQGTFTDQLPGLGVPLNEYYQHSTLGLTLSKNLVGGRGILSDDIIKLSTNMPPNISAPQNGGVNFSTSSQNKWGGGWLNFTTYDTSTGGALSSNIIIDGLGGEIKSLNKIESGILGSTGAGASKTLTSSLNQGVITISSDNSTPVTLFKAEGSSLGTDIKINDTTGTTVVNINSLTGASPNIFKCYNQTSGYAYISNGFGVNTGFNSDNVGLMSLTSTHTAVARVDILQLNSDFTLSPGYPPAGTYGTNLINCKNSTSTVDGSGSLFKVDVAGKVNQQTDQDIDNVTFDNIRTGLGGLFFTKSVVVAQSQFLQPLPPYNYFDTPQSPAGGFSFLKCNLPNVAGSVWTTRCQIDGDGSIKNMISLTVSDANSTWPPVGDSRNITLVPGADAIITTRYSTHTAGTELSLQADGPIGLGLTYQNMVKIQPNTGADTLGFKLENKSSPNSNTENIMWWTRNSAVDSHESLYMIVNPKITSNARPIFEFKGGATLGGVTPYFLRYYPEGLNSSGAGNPPIIIGDDRNVTIQLGGGKAAAAGTTTSTQGRISANLIDCDFIDVLNIDSGSASVDLSIGTNLTQNVDIELGNSGSIHMGNGSYIRCTAAGTPATGSTGPTNIVNANHTGYIGTGSLVAVNQTGLRGSSVITTFAASANKTYIAPNLATAADGAYVTASCIEGPQGTIFLRGQVKLAGVDATIDLDAATALVGTMIMPHNFPVLGWVPGTFGAMFQNPQVTVSNAGIIGPTPPVPPNINTYTMDILFTPVQGIITLTGASGAQQALLIIQSQNPVPDLVVNYIVCAERKDTYYMDPSNNFVQHYDNLETGTTETWNGGASPTQLDAQFGAGSWS